MCEKKPSHGDLRVWWIPQIPMSPFYVSVASPAEAKKILDVLADYDQFQLDNRIKPDYGNVGGLAVFDEQDDSDGPAGSWVDWETEDGENIDEWEPEESAK